MTLPLGCKDRDDDKDARPSRQPTTRKASASAAKAEEVKLSADAVLRNGIKVGIAKKQVLAPSIVAPARVSFNTEAMARVGSPLAGRVVEVKVRMGDRVQKGDVLIVIESPELGEAQSDYLQKRTAVTLAATAIETVKAAYERGKALREKNEGISLAELQKREGELKTAQGTLESARAALMAAENKLRLLGMDDKAVADFAQNGKISPRLPLTAPISAQVIERKTTLGELVAPEKESLLVLADMTSLWVLADVPESKLAEVQVGTTASVRVAALSDDALAGTVAFISPSLDPSTGCAQVRIEVKNPPTDLRPGMFAQAEMRSGRKSDAQPVLAVPEKAVLIVEGTPTVFVPVAGKENTFARRPVGVGGEVGGMVPIFSCLKEGEPLVVSGAFILKAELGKGTAEEDSD